MFADLFFIVLVIIGLLAAIPATILIVAGLIKKVRATVIIGMFIAIIPIICFGLYCWFYYINLPNVKAQNVTDFSGQYQVDQTTSWIKNKEKFATRLIT